MFSFANTNAFVIGAASGIGRAMALELAKRGARVAAADLDEAGVCDTAASINSLGGSAIGLQCDINDLPSLDRAVNTAEDWLGAIDVSVNAVGVLLSGYPEDIPISEWERIFQTNLLGAARLNSLLMAKMIARSYGYIVNTASVAGLYPFAITRIPYAASKAALISMAENLAIYLKPRGVRVSCLCPGPTITSISSSATNWTEGIPTLGPGSDYALITAQRSAEVFCDGMAAEKVIILAQEQITTDYLRSFAAGPDDFIDARITQYAHEDHGLPQIDFADPEIAAALKALDLSADKTAGDD